MIDSFEYPRLKGFRPPPLSYVDKAKAARVEDIPNLNLSNVRLIARLDIKSENLVKGIHLEGLRVIGDPQIFARRYFEEGADELLYMDIVASLYNRSHLVEIVKRTAQNVFIPVTVGGGIRSVEDVKTLLRAGADKVAINTAATQRPELIREISKRFGAQCVVLSIEAKRIAPHQWEAYANNGRTPTGLEVTAWAKRGVELGAGEILLTSVDQEGTRRGFDVGLVKAVVSSISVPVIASGGMGNFEHLYGVVHNGLVDAVAMADVLHYKRLTLKQIREAALSAHLPVRQI